MAVMIDLHGSSANTENLLRIRSGPANRLKETVQYVFVIFRHQIYSDIFLLYLTVLFYDPVIIHFLVRFTTYFGFDL